MIPSNAVKQSRDIQNQRQKMLNMSKSCRFMLVSLERLPEDIAQRYGFAEKSSEPHFQMKVESDPEPQPETRPDSGFESGIERTDKITKLAPSVDTDPEDSKSSDEITETIQQKENSRHLEMRENNVVDPVACEVSDVNLDEDKSVKEMTYSGQEDNKLSPVDSQENEHDLSALSNNKLSPITPRIIDYDQMIVDKSTEIDPYDFESAEGNTSSDKSQTSDDVNFKIGCLLVNKKCHDSNYLSNRKNYAPKANKAIKIASRKNTKGKGSKLALDSSVSHAADLSHVSLQENADTHSEKVLSIDSNGRKLAEKKNNIAPRQTDVNGLTRVFTWQTEQPWQGNSNACDYVGNESNNSGALQEIGLDLSTSSRKEEQPVDPSLLAQPRSHSKIQVNGSADTSSFNKYFNQERKGSDTLNAKESFNLVALNASAGITPSDSRYLDRKSDSPLSTASTASLCIDYPLPEEDTDVIQTSSLDLSMTGCNKNGIVNTGTVPTIKMQEAEIIVRNIELSVDSNKAQRQIMAKKPRKLQKKHTARKSHGRLGKDQYYVKLNPDTGNPVVTKRKASETVSEPPAPKTHRTLLEKPDNTDIKDTKEDINNVIIQQETSMQEHSSFDIADSRVDRKQADILQQSIKILDHNHNNMPSLKSRESSSHSGDNSSDIHSDVVHDRPPPDLARTRKRFRRFRSISVGSGLRLPIIRPRIRRRRKPIKTMIKEKPKQQPCTPVSNERKTSHETIKPILERAWVNILKNDFQESAKKAHFTKASNSKLPFKATSVSMPVTSSIMDSKANVIPTFRGRMHSTELAKRLMQPPKLNFSHTLLTSHFYSDNKPKESSLAAISSGQRSNEEVSKYCGTLSPGSFGTRPELKTPPATIPPLIRSSLPFNGNGSRQINITTSHDDASVQKEDITSPSTEDSSASPPPLMSQPIQISQVNDVSEAAYGESEEQISPSDLTVEKTNTVTATNNNASDGSVKNRNISETKADPPHLITENGKGEKVEESDVSGDENCKVNKRENSISHDLDGNVISGADTADDSFNQPPAVTSDKKSKIQSNYIDLTDNDDDVPAKDPSVVYLHLSPMEENNAKTKLLVEELDMLIAKRELELQSLYSRRACALRKIRHDVSKDHMGSSYMKTVQVEYKKISQKPRPRGRPPNALKAPPAHQHENSLPNRYTNLQKPYMGNKPSPKQSNIRVVKWEEIEKERIAFEKFSTRRAQMQANQRMHGPVYNFPATSESKAPQYLPINQQSANTVIIDNHQEPYMQSNIPVSMHVASSQQIHLVNNAEMGNQNGYVARIGGNQQGQIVSSRIEQPEMYALVTQPRHRPIAHPNEPSTQLVDNSQQTQNASYVLVPASAAHIQSPPVVQPSQAGSRSQPEALVALSSFTQKPIATSFSQPIPTTQGTGIPTGSTANSHMGNGQYMVRVPSAMQVRPQMQGRENGVTFFPRGVSYRQMHPQIPVQLSPGQRPQAVVGEVPIKMQAPPPYPGSHPTENVNPTPLQPPQAVIRPPIQSSNVVTAPQIRYLTASNAPHQRTPMAVNMLQVMPSSAVNPSQGHPPPPGSQKAINFSQMQSPRAVNTAQIRSPTAVNPSLKSPPGASSQLGSPSESQPMAPAVGLQMQPTVAPCTGLPQGEQGINMMAQENQQTSNNFRTNPTQHIIGHNAVTPQAGATSSQNSRESMTSVQQIVPHQTTYALPYQPNQHRLAAENDPTEKSVCQACNKPALFLCAACQVVWYCSKECQVAAWPSHQRQCVQRN